MKIQRLAAALLLALAALFLFSCCGEPREDLPWVPPHAKAYWEERDGVWHFQLGKYARFLGWDVAVRDGEAVRFPYVFTYRISGEELKECAGLSAPEAVKIQLSVCRDWTADNGYMQQEQKFQQPLCIAVAFAGKEKPAGFRCYYVREWAAFAPEDYQVWVGDRYQGNSRLMCSSADLQILLALLHALRNPGLYPATGDFTGVVQGCSFLELIPVYEE